MTRQLTINQEKIKGIEVSTDYWFYQSFYKPIRGVCHSDLVHTKNSCPTNHRMELDKIKKYRWSVEISLESFQTTQFGKRFPVYQSDWTSKSWKADKMLSLELW